MTNATTADDIRAQIERLRPELTEAIVSGDVRRDRDRLEARLEVLRRRLAEIESQ